MDILKDPHVNFHQATTHYVFKTDIDGYLTYVNELFESRFGKLINPLIGGYSLDLIHPDDQAKCVHTVEQCFAYPERSFQVVLRKPLINGRYIWNHWDFRAIIREGDAGLVGIQGVGHDVSAARQLSFISGLEQADVLELIEQIDEGFFALDRDWTIRYINVAFEQIIGLDRKQILQCNLWEVFPEAKKTQFFSMYHRAMVSRQKVRFEEYFAPLEKWFLAVAYPSQHGGLYVFFSDITNQKRFEKQILSQNDKLRDIAFIQSHNMRRPVANIQGIMDILNLDCLKKEDWELIEGLRDNTQELDRLIHIINDRIYDIS